MPLNASRGDSDAFCTRSGGKYRNVVLTCGFRGFKCGCVDALEGKIKRSTIVVQKGAEPEGKDLPTGLLLLSAEQPERRWRPKTEQKETKYWRI